MLLSAVQRGIGNCKNGGLVTFTTSSDFILFANSLFLLLCQNETPFLILLINYLLFNYLFLNILSDTCFLLQTQNILLISEMYS